VDLVDRSDRVLVYRRGFEVAVESIAPGERSRAAVAARREALGAVAEKARGGGRGHRATSRCFERWARLGLVVGCELEGAAH
jgi:hypothetical protein